MARETDKAQMMVRRLTHNGIMKKLKIVRSLPGIVWRAKVCVEEASQALREKLGFCTAKAALRKV